MEKPNAKAKEKVVSIDDAKHCKRKLLRPARALFTEVKEPPDLIDRPCLIPEDIAIVAIGAYLIGVISGVILAW